MYALMKRSEMSPEQLAAAREAGRNYSRARRARLKAAAEAEAATDAAGTAEPATLTAVSTAEEHKDGNVTDSIPTDNNNSTSLTPEDSPSQNVLSSGIIESPAFLCCNCGAMIPLGISQCPKCSIAVDWRGVPAIEESEELIVCDECGIVFSLEDWRKNPHCPRCGYTGKKR